jgi:hypothetical protein
MTRRKTKQKRVAESKGASLPPGTVAADHSQLAHNNTYSPLPKFYVDKVVVCRQCGKEETWPAERQKWWYEVAKGNIFTEAVLCKACRQTAKEKKAEARRIHLEGLARKRARSKKQDLA